MWDKFFFPWHNDAQNRCTSLRAVTVSLIFSISIFHLPNYVSVWVILSHVLLYAIHTSASLRQNSPLSSVSFAKARTSRSILVLCTMPLCVMFTPPIAIGIQLWLIYSRSNLRKLQKKKPTNPHWFPSALEINTVLPAFILVQVWFDPPITAVLKWA